MFSCPSQIVYSKIQRIVVPAGDSPIAVSAATAASAAVARPRGPGILGVGAVGKGEVPEAVRGKGGPPVFLGVLVPVAKKKKKKGMK